MNLICTSEWIPASERLPDEGKDVLWAIDAYGPSCVYKIGHRYAGDSIFADDGVSYWLTRATYWMPLPEQPTDAK